VPCACDEGGAWISRRMMSACTVPVGGMSGVAGCRRGSGGGVLARRAAVVREAPRAMFSFRPGGSRRASVKKKEVGPMVERVPKWRDVFADLSTQEIAIFEPSGLAQALKAGWTLVDVRPAAEVEARGTVDGALEAPLFEASKAINLKNLLLASMAVQATALNVDWLDALPADGNAKVIFMCDKGGEVERTGMNPVGTQSRSLVAAWVAAQVGFENVGWLRGGHFDVLRYEAGEPTMRDLQLAAREEWRERTTSE